MIRVPFDEARRLSPRFWFELLPTWRRRCLTRSRSTARQAREKSGGPCAIAGSAWWCAFPASQNVPDGLPCRTVLFQHNVEAAIWRRHADVRANPLARAYFREQWRRMERFERQECRRFNRVVAVSRADAETIERDYGVAGVSDVPTGVDIDYFRPAGRATQAQ
jgi:glycosyltransferase involved in cell wall biosynthesis